MKSDKSYDAVVVGCGIAGLSAAVSAAQQGKKVAVLERAPFEQRGGNTRYTEAFLRMKNDSEINDDFVDQLVANSGGHLDPTMVAETAADYENWPPMVKAMAFTDPELINVFASNVVPTIQWLKTFGIRFEALGTPFISVTGTRMMPVGGGLAMLEALAAAAEKNYGVQFIYETTAQDLLQDDDGRVVGVRARSKNRWLDIRADNVVLACGGFEGNPEMLAQYQGQRALYQRPMSPGSHYNKGEGIRMALKIGAAPSGEYASYHAATADPRSSRPGASVLVYPYGILVNKAGERFVDEASSTPDETFEGISLRIPSQPEGVAYVIVDAKISDVQNYQRAIKTEQPPLVADSISGLAAKLGIPGPALEKTVAAYNQACRPGNFNPYELDGLCTNGLEPCKSNFARPLDKAPFSAWPIISLNVFTMGGLKVDPASRVLSSDGEVIPGLYAAGETIGLFFKKYPGATSVLRGATFGRIAGLDIAGKRALAT